MLGPGLGPADPFGLDLVRHLPEAGGIGQHDGEAGDVEMDLDDIPGGAGAGRDNRRLAASQVIQNT